MIDDDLDDLQEPEPTLAERVRHLSKRLEQVRYRSPPPEPAPTTEQEPNR